MDPLVRKLFHELVDLSSSQREKVFAEKGISPDVRIEVESLLSFDVADEQDVMRWGPYRSVRLLGRGGMGSVYLAERTDGEIQRKVAIKFLRSDIQRPAWRERFLLERQLLAYLNHPSIVHLIDAGHASDGRPYLVMEYVDGVPIDDYCVEMDLRDSLQLFLRVCEGVSHAHHRLIIHRDLKPSNILVDASGQPKLLDFGIAKLLDDNANRTQTVERLLTPNYASPEQLQGAAESTGTDVYSLAAVLHRILKGRTPNEPVVSGAADLPSDLEYVLRKALRKEPEERYGSVEAFATDIRAFLDWRPVHARSGDKWYRTRKFLRRYWVPVWVSVLVIVGLSAGLYVVNRERSVAQMRFDQVRQLSNRVLALDEIVQRLPGSTSARNEIVAMSKDYLERLTAERLKNKDLDFELATAFYKLAQVQGLPTSNNLGQYAQAAQSLLAADNLIRQVLADSSSDRKALLLAAEISEGRMILADTDHNDDDAMDFARKGAGHVEAFLEAENDPIRRRIEPSGFSQTLLWRSRTCISIPSPSDAPVEL